MEGKRTNLAYFRLKERKNSLNKELLKPNKQHLNYSMDLRKKIDID